MKVFIYFNPFLYFFPIQKNLHLKFDQWTQKKMQSSRVCRCTALSAQCVLNVVGACTNLKCNPYHHRTRTLVGYNVDQLFFPLCRHSNQSKKKRFSSVTMLCHSLLATAAAAYRSFYSIFYIRPRMSHCVKISSKCDYMKR